jgi:hypothetical protein
MQGLGALSGTTSHKTPFILYILFFLRIEEFINIIGRAALNAASDG